MKKILLATVALVAVGATVPALAADLAARPYTKAPAYVPAPIYNWIQGGADYEFSNNVVLGVQAEYSWLTDNNNGVMFPLGTVATSNSNELGSVTGRVGYSFGAALLYAKGGYAFKDGDHINVTSGGVSVPFTTDGGHRDGYTVGAGLEYMFAPNWSATIEYQYYNFGSGTFTSGPADIVGARFTDDDHTVKAGINYRFNWGGPVARY
jgi:outer membrane immunogenic protein